MWRHIATNPNSPHKTQYKKWLKATYDRSPDFPELIVNHSQEHTPSSSMNLNNFKDILDFCPKTLVTNKTLLQDPLTTSFPTTLPHIIISLSGGVDSMVASYIASQLYPKDKISFAHINYANRETSHKEAHFVQQWASHLNIPLYTRTIIEINRNNCMDLIDLRSTYESYTKRVRYNLYTNITQPSTAHVILGHNQDDCFENILTNITSSQKYDNLIGMTPITIHSNNLTFHRPFLNISKQHIINFAKQHNIPYLYDSTPKWSQRGKIRDIIVPTLNTWNSSCIPAFFKLAAHLESLSQVSNSITNSIINTAQQLTPSTYELSLTTEPKALTPQLWHDIFISFCKQYQIAKYPSHKSITNFAKNVSMQTKIHLTKSLIAQLSPENTLHITLC
jgi:tRNA(Ile)-lysidine synthetase-like protein